MTANPPVQGGARTPGPAARADFAPVRRQLSPAPARPDVEPPGPLLRRLIGAVLRRIRLGQGRTLRDVSRAAGVSLPYLSELERGRKEPSSEVLGAICRALGMRLADLLDEVRDELFRLEPPGRGSVARVVRGRVMPGHDGRVLPGRGDRPGWDQAAARPSAGPRSDVREHGPVLLGGALPHPPAVSGGRSHVGDDAARSYPNDGIWRPVGGRAHRIGFGAAGSSDAGPVDPFPGFRPLTFRLVGFGETGLGERVVLWPPELPGSRVRFGGARRRRGHRSARRRESSRRPRPATSRLVVFCGRDVPAAPGDPARQVSGLRGQP